MILNGQNQGFLSFHFRTCVIDKSFKVLDVNYVNDYETQVMLCENIYGWVH